jgi:menaquinone-dependent protoporphyrinogen oxidase
MGDQRVLVAFANQAGSTAWIAGVIAAVLVRSGLVVDCRVAREVADVTPYGAVILGSGVFVTGRRSDGGGFLTRHEAALASRPVWLFCAGPIGRGRCVTGTTAGAIDDCSVVTVARDVGARGAAVFGPVGVTGESDAMDRLGPVNLQRVRTWAAEIAADLGAVNHDQVSGGRSPSDSDHHIATSP